MSRPDPNKGHEEVIDKNLRRVFQESLDEGIPDRFMSLLDQLKQQDSDQSSNE